ncbi:MAG: hypothetical protein N2489_01135 [Clostridia bacterium]|nr:hypothetical protein [Clostridia bacterium]
MNEKEIFDKINDMLTDTDFPLEIRSIADLEDFLNDDDNRRFESFELIGRLYDNLVYRNEVDRYPEGI